MFDRFVWSHVLAYERKQGISNHSSHAISDPADPAILSIDHASGHVKCDTRTLGDDLLRVPSSSIQIVDLGGERLDDPKRRKIFVSLFLFVYCADVSFVTHDPELDPMMP